MDKDVKLKKAIETVFDCSAIGYKDICYFPPFGKLLAENSGIGVGNRVLDVACGRGASLIPAAYIVGPSGSIIGVDISSKMIEQTLADVKERGLANIGLRQMDAENLDFNAQYFDVILCGFALPFFPKPKSAVDEFFRVLKKGGKLGVTTWAGVDPRWTWFDDLCKSYGAVAKLQTEPFEDIGTLIRMCEHVGFDTTKTEVIEHEVVFEEQEWWNIQWSVSRRAGLEQLGAKALEQLKNETFSKLKAMKIADGLKYNLRANLALFKKEE